MFSECLPVTYNPLQGMHACRLCAVVLMKDYPLVFSIKSGASRGRREREKTLKDYIEVGKQFNNGEAVTDKTAQTAAGLTCC